MRTLPLACLLLLTAASAIAQTKVVSPRLFAKLPGNSSNAFPFSGVPTILSQRFQAVHDDMQGVPGVIKGFAVRIDEDETSVLCTCNIEVRISTAAVTGATATTTYDTNHGPDKVTVVGPSTPISFPPTTSNPPDPSPFTFTVPFTTPFVFLGTGGIAWEALCDSRVLAADTQMDGVIGQSAFNYYGVNFGSGCIASGRSAPATTSAAYSAAAGVTFSGSLLANSAPAGIVLGLSKTSWLSLPLPLDLPGTTGYPSGTCRVHSDWVVQLTGSTTATGTLSIPVPITLGPATYGATLYHYAYCLDAAANALGIVTSNARYDILGDGSMFGGCRVFNNNNNAATTGSKSTVIPVTEFWY